ncbi:astacin-like metalloendopeptidase [Orbicella faveolata]|uniref:astacin-like metalloendopeptidase n=1 Tax=Orbicella faveolata TaxID=48498 RepID=UPI0009E59E0D|nr:astacin-like metalloendopeptidase [Orbicella faveolata]
MKLATFCLVFSLFVYDLKFHSDGALSDQTSAKVEDINYSIEKANDAGFVFQRDVVFSDRSNKSLRTNTTRNRSKRNFVALKRFWWNSESIPYMLDKSLGLSGRKAFQAAITEFEWNTCIRFIRHTNEEDYIWVHRGSGCFSATGKTGGKQLLSLGKGCQTKGVVIHELLHALGMMHEHCRPDRNQFIRINANNIKPKARVEYRVLKGYVIGEPYDYGSVMHYGFNFFSVDSKRPIIVKLMPGGKQMGQRDGFSDLDLRKINKFYNCTKYIKSIKTPKKEIIKIVSGDCSFERGLCNWKNWKNEEEDQFDWMIGKAVAKSQSKTTPQYTSNLTNGRFLFFTKPSTRAEYMSSGVLYSAGYFKGSSCLRFYYHMRTGGYLKVFTKEAASKEKNPYVLIWEREGPQGNKWNVMEKSLLGAIIKIYIEGIKSPTLTGFVAIDDIRVSQGKACLGMHKEVTRH